MSSLQLKPAAEWSEEEVADAPYDLLALQGPQLVGLALSGFRAMCENYFTKEILYKVYIYKNRVNQVR